MVYEETMYFDILLYPICDAAIIFQTKYRVKSFTGSEGKMFFSENEISACEIWFYNFREGQEQKC